MPGGAPKGNNNAGSGTEWREAIRAVTLQYAKGDIKRKMALRKVAETLLEKALAGDMTAIKEFGDRFDGKPGQALELSGGVDVRSFPLEYVKPKPRDT